MTLPAPCAVPPTSAAVAAVEPDAVRGEILNHQALDRAIGCGDIKSVGFRGPVALDGHGLRRGPRLRHALDDDRMRDLQFGLQRDGQGPCEVDGVGRSAGGGVGVVDRISEAPGPAVVAACDGVGLGRGREKLPFFEDFDVQTSAVSLRAARGQTVSASRIRELGHERRLRNWGIVVPVPAPGASRERCSANANVRAEAQVASGEFLGIL